MARRRSLLGILASPRLAAWILGAGALFLLAGSYVPQVGVVGESAYDAWAERSPALVDALRTLGLDSMFSSWLFLGMGALLVLNLTACTWDRARRRMRRSPRAVETPPASARVIAVGVDGATLGSGLVSRLRGRWRIHHPASNHWVAETGRIGFLGSVIMHLGLIVVVIAGIVSGLTRFSGTVVITEGQTIVDAPEAYVSVARSPRLGAAFTGAAVTLDDLRFTYDGETVTDAVAVMSYDDGRSAGTREAAVNRPLRAAGKAYLLSDAGYSVGVLVERGSTVVFDSYVNLGEPVAEGYSDVLELSDGIVLGVVAVPDGSLAPGARASQVLLLRDPQVRFDIEIDGAEAGMIALAPGESRMVGDLRVSLADVRLWNTFYVRADKGLPIMYWAFLFVLLGTALRWWDPDAVIGILVTGDDDAVHIWSTTRYGHSLVLTGESEIELLVRNLGEDGDD